MIPLIREECSSLLDAENCCFCHRATCYWTALPERASDQQVALCSDCAKTHTRIQIPSKRAWCDLEQAREWARGRVLPWQRNTATFQRIRAGIMRRNARAFREYQRCL